MLLLLLPGPSAGAGPAALHPWLQLPVRQSTKSQGSEIFHGVCAGIELVLLFAETLPDSPLLVCGIPARSKQAQPGFGCPQRACSQSAPESRWEMVWALRGVLSLQSLHPLIFGVPWLQNKGGALGLGRMLKCGDERGKDSAPESGA